MRSFEVGSILGTYGTLLEETTAYHHSRSWSLKTESATFHDCSDIAWLPNVVKLNAKDNLVVMPCLLLVYIVF